MLYILCDCSVPYILKQGLPPDSELAYLASLASEIRGSPSFPPICCDNKHTLPPNIHGSTEILNCSPYACVTSVSSLLYPRSHQSQQHFLLKVLQTLADILFAYMCVYLHHFRRRCWRRGSVCLWLCVRSALWTLDQRMIIHLYAFVETLIEVLFLELCTSDEWWLRTLCWVITVLFIMVGG